MSVKIWSKLRNRLYRYQPLESYYGPEFKKIYGFLQQSRTWNRDQIREYKFGKLAELIQHAEKNVPFYGRRFAEYGVGSHSLKDFNDFKKFPILTKQDIKENFEQIKANNIEQYKPTKAKTAGTTGQMTNLYRSGYHESFRKAVLWRIYNESGYEFRQKRVTVDDPPSFKPDSPLFEHDRIENNLIINTYHLMQGRSDEIYRKIRDFSPRMIWGHPTFLAILGDYARKNDLKPLEIPVIATYAEKIYPYTRALMDAFCRGNHLDYYGNKENTIAAWGHADGKFFEVSEYCHLEVAPGSLQSGDDNSGDLITTSLNNYAFPLIRYMPGDIVSLNGFKNDKIPYPEITLHGGRGKDLLLTRDGLTIPHLVDYLEHNNFVYLKKHQIEQISLDKIIVRVVTDTGYDKAVHEPVLYKLAQESTAHQFDIEIEYAEDIPLTERGKFPAIISKLAVEKIQSDLNMR